MNQKRDARELRTLDPTELDGAVGGNGLTTALKFGAKAVKWGAGAARRVGKWWNGGANAVSNAAKPTADAAGNLGKAYGAYEGGATAINGTTGSNLPTPLVDRATGQ